MTDERKDGETREQSVGRDRSEAARDQAHMESGSVAEAEPASQAISTHSRSATRGGERGGEMKCPKCKNGELKRRDTQATARLECSDENCGYVEVFREEQIRKLAEDEEAWMKIAGGSAK